MPTVTRRTLLAGSAAAALAAGTASAAAAAPPAGKQTPGIYRYRIGTFELTALYDGIWYRPITDKFIRNAPFAEVGARTRRRLYAGRQAGDAVHDADRQYRQKAGAHRYRHRRPDRALGRRVARQSRRRRHRSEGGRPHRHLAFPSRPHQRHQGQGQRPRLPQCRDHGAGGGMEFLDGRRQLERRAGGSETHLPQSAADIFRYRAAASRASSRERRSRPAL